MKGKLIPTDMTSATYTDVNDQDWMLSLSVATGKWVAHLADDVNMYKRPTSETLAAASAQNDVAEAIDGWVDDWNAGANPAPRIEATVSASKGSSGGLIVALVVIALLVATDKGKRR